MKSIINASKGEKIKEKKNKKIKEAKSSPAVKVLP